jgi:hypothetical protein
MIRSLAIFVFLFGQRDVDGRNFDLPNSFLGVDPSKIDDSSLPRRDRGCSQRQRGARCIVALRCSKAGFEPTATRGPDLPLQV